jgi:hypothetical protein
MASLNGIGLTGWQMLTARALELAQYLKDRLSQLDNCLVLNQEAPGPSVVWWVLPKGRNATSIYRALCEGRLSPEETQRTFTEVRRLYEKRERSLDPQRDARLSFTTDFGYHVQGHSLPGWKAVFFNPQTDETIIDRLIYSIEELL